MSLAELDKLHTMELPYHWDERPWRWDLLVSEAPLMQQAWFAVPDAPGLVVEPNHEVCRAHVKDGYRYFD